MMALALRHWKVLAGIGGAVIIIACFNIWLSAAKSAAYERGYEAADLECAKAREAARIARDKKLAEIEKEQKRINAEWQQKVNAAKKLSDDLNRRAIEANSRAREAERKAQNAIEKALRDTGNAGCEPTGSVSDEYNASLSAYRSYNDHEVR